MDKNTIAVRRATLGVLALITVTLAGCPAYGPNPPAAAFQVNVMSGAAPLTVAFTDVSTSDETITSWTWLFGDGTVSSEQNPMHTYAEPGTYHVSLTVTSAGGVDTELKLNLIVVSEPAATCVPGTATGEEKTIMLPGDVPLVMVRIPAGCFTMGTSPAEQDARAWEGPAHEVTFASDFWMAKYETTQAQWEAVMGTRPWQGQGDVVDDPDGPAIYVTWRDAREFYRALNELAEGDFALPSEAQWEYACRAGTTTRMYWGDDPQYVFGDDYAWWYWTAIEQSTFGAQVVGQKLPNAWGLYDMIGNVEEYCEDLYHRSYIGAPTDGSAWLADPDDDTRALRGGGYNGPSEIWRSSSRRFIEVGHARGEYGFRLVATGL